MKWCYLVSVWALFHSSAAADDDPFDFSSVFGETLRAKLNFSELAKYDGYDVEEHSVTTEDGYILGVFRIPLKESCQVEDKTPLIFMHGLFLSGDDCLIPGPNKSHCSIYADACIDMWIPNVRGNRYSRHHVTLDPDKDAAFWNFSVDEMGVYDMPAIIDYILEQTGQKQVNFVGHSQGVTMALILCSKKPEYNAKFKVGVGLSTTAWMGNARFVVVQVQGALSPILTVANNAGVNSEILRHGGLTQRAATALCGLSPLEYPLCSVLIFTLLGYNRFQITDETLRVLVGHTPAGTSLKDFNRWGQIRKNGFTEYDYGVSGNLMRYNQISPPFYEVGKISMKWVFLASLNDYVSDVRDLAILVPKIQNATKCILPDKTFGHLDFIYGRDIPNYITPKVLSIIITGNFVCD